MAAVLIDYSRVGGLCDEDEARGPDQRREVLMMDGERRLDEMGHGG